MKNPRILLAAATSAILLPAIAANAAGETVSDDVIAQQRAALAESTNGAGFGPQSPRDLDMLDGSNARAFEAAPAYAEMNLCNIHFHENAEHRGGDFTKYAGNGDGKGTGTGYLYNGSLTADELAPYGKEVGAGKYGSLVPGDTIELHYVHTTAQVKPGPTLGSCLSDAIMNPQLRVETQVYVLVNDDAAADFVEDLGCPDIANRLRDFLPYHEFYASLSLDEDLPENAPGEAQYSEGATWLEENAAWKKVLDKVNAELERSYPWSEPDKDEIADESDQPN